MTRAAACALAGLGALVLLGATTPGARRMPRPAPPRSIDDRCVLPAVAAPESLLSSGRYWHAWRAVPPLPGTQRVPAESVVLRATIAEGLERYADVDALLRRARGGDSLPAFLLLQARSDERAERWMDAAARYRRVLAVGIDTDARLASARLAFVLERVGLRDSAIAAWRRAAQYSPEVADWMALRRAALERDTALAFAGLSAQRTPGSLQQAQLFIAGRRYSLGDYDGALALYQRYGKPLDVARAEYAMGRRIVARARADTLLVRDAPNTYSPNAILAATFLSERFDDLTLEENLAASRSYRVRRDLAGAERFARAAVARSVHMRPDTALAGWLELARVESERRSLLGALRALDSAAARSRGRGAPVGVGRVRALGAAEYWDKADTLLGQLVRSYPGDSGVARAVLEFADRHRGRGERDAELARYRLMLARFAETPAANTARFRVGLVAYASGQRDTALAIVADAERRDSSRALGLAPRYWSARLRLEGGDSVTGIASLRAIANDQPLAFYGVRAREILGDTAFLSDSMPPLPRPGSFPPARARERIRLLVMLGLDQEARAESVGWASDTTASVYVLVAAAAAAGEAGYARESIVLGEAARARVGMVPGVARALFPLSYRAALEAEAAEHCVDPLLMAALIRQESRFDPHAVSRVGARGLSQVMPATGQQLAQRTRMGPWDPALLFTPDFNLHLGSLYVSDRMTRDTFQLYALLASYNAGAARVTRWRSWPEYGDTDLFSERVSIAETRDYVRTVYASYVWYRYAWATPPERPAPVP